ncbi:MAG: hypothetical protein FWC50_07500, partial [Planctomycetaceae bacterium]|nr:hypothetical protein [Planctomycetaceae bacterium]
MNVSGESPVSPKCKKHPIFLGLCISAQSAAVEALCIFSRHHNISFFDAIGKRECFDDCIFAQTVRRLLAWTQKLNRHLIFWPRRPQLPLVAAIQLLCPG